MQKERQLAELGEERRGGRSQIYQGEKAWYTIIH
jgi:hypothetical protein